MLRSLHRNRSTSSVQGSSLPKGVLTKGKMIIQSVYRIYSNPPAEVALIDPTEGRIELMLINVLNLHRSTISFVPNLLQT